MFRHEKGEIDESERSAEEWKNIEESRWRISQPSSLAARLGSITLAPSKNPGKGGTACVQERVLNVQYNSSAFHHRLCNWEPRWLFVSFSSRYPIMSLSDKPPLFGIELLFSVENSDSYQPLERGWPSDTVRQKFSIVCMYVCVCV